MIGEVIERHQSSFNMLSGVLFSLCFTVKDLIININQIELQVEF